MTRRLSDGTGALTGIGRSIVVAFAKEGARASSSSSPGRGGQAPKPVRGLGASGAFIKAEVVMARRNSPS